MSIVRDLLGALEHAHAHGIIMRRIAPTTLMLDLAGRAIITDLRYSNWCLAYAPADLGPGAAFSAPEVRGGAAGEPSADVYTVGALVYFALTGQEPALDPAAIVSPQRLRGTIPAAVERVILRALRPAPGDRYFTATEMLEDFVADAGTFQAPAAEPQHGESGFERRLPVDRVVRLLDQALSALEQAHAFGLVHRDLKPENMLLEPDGRLRITDFGLALALRGDGRYGGATSRSGTPQFASPEQLLGEKVTPRTDLYSLGAVGYFALLGRPPFEGPTPEAILAKQTTDILPDLHAERPAVERELEVVLRRAVASRPEQRFTTATRFREALHEATGGWWRRLWKLLRPD